MATDMVGVRETSAPMAATSSQLQSQAVALAQMGQVLQDVIGQFTV